MLSLLFKEVLFVKKIKFRIGKMFKITGDVAPYFSTTYLLDCSVLWQENCKKQIIINRITI